MSERDKRKRRTLFSLYAGNLSLYFPHLANVFICPLCLRQFGVKALDGRDPELSIAHVFPDSLGGRRVTLACKACNSTVGHRLEAALAKERDLNEWWAGKRPLRVRFNNSKSDAALELNFSKDRERIEVKLRAKQTDPHDWKTIIDNPPDNDDPLRAKLPTPDSESLVLALIHSAFMLMFSELGYEYILSENVDAIRNLLHGTPPLAQYRNIVAPLPASIRDPKLVADSINVLIQPDEYKCFLVGVPASPDSQWTRCVLLPGFWDSGKAAYEKLCANCQPPERFSAVLMKFCCPVNKRLSDAKHRHFARAFWDRQFPKTVK